MAETIATTGATPGTAADWARVIANAQAQEADIANAVAQATNEAEFAALIAMLGNRSPVVIQTDQLQEFLRLVLPEDAQQTQTQEDVAPQTQGQTLPPPPTLTTTIPMQTTTIPTQTTQTTPPTASPTLPTTIPTPSTLSNPVTTSPATNQLPTNPYSNNTPTTDLNVATTTNASMLNTDPVIVTSSPALLRPANNLAAQIAPSSQSLDSNVIDNRAVSNLRAAYNAQTAEEVVSPKLSQLLTAQTSTVFGTALAGRPVPVSVAMVDPQRLLGDHTGENAKAFLLGKEEQPFSVVVFQEVITPQAMANRTAINQIEAALNMAIAKAFPEEPPTHVRVAQLNNGMFAIVYEPTRSGEPLRAAPLLSNAGFALLAEPTHGGEQLLPRLTLAMAAREGMNETTREASAPKGGNGRAEQSGTSTEAQTWSSILTGWFHAPGSMASSHIPSTLGLGVAFLLAALFVLDTKHIGEYFIAAASLAGVAAAISMWQKREEETSPLRLIRPAIRYLISRVKRTGEPWVFFARERDWTEWSRRTRLRMAVQDAQRRVAAFFLPPEHRAFETLGLNVDAKWDDVNTAFRTLAKRYHPDSAPAASDDMHEALNEEFHRIMSAYVVLRRKFQLQKNS